LNWQESERSAGWVEPWLTFLSDVRAIRYCSRDPMRIADFGLDEPEVEIDWNLRQQGTIIAHRLVVSGGEQEVMFGMLDESGWVFEFDSDEAQALGLMLEQLPQQSDEDTSTALPLQTTNPEGDSDPGAGRPNNDSGVAEEPPGQDTAGRGRASGIAWGVL